MSSKKNYLNPEFVESFQRVKEILIDLKNKIMPVKQGNAVNFRQNINDAIGTIPETDQETGAITKDGKGMSGAVFAMGEAFEIGLKNLGDALNEFDEDSTDILTKATESKDKILGYESVAQASASNAKASEISAKTSETNAGLSASNAKTSETNAKTYEDGIIEFANNIETYVDGKIDDAVKEATDAADRANQAAEGITNTFVCLAQGNSETEEYAANSYPVTVDAEGNETKITQSYGAVWFKIVSEVNTNTENTENTENTQNTEIV